MQTIKRKVVIITLVLIGTVIGVFKGTEARQKWVFKIKDKYINRRHIAEQRSIARNGGVLLDDIELSSYHS